MDEKYGSEGSSDASDSEDSEDTQEDSDAAIFCALARVRKKVPAIYEGDGRVFEGGSLLSWGACGIRLFGPPTT